MTLYHGTRSGDRVNVTADGDALDPRYDLLPENRAGFEWGYIGAGPARLSLALLANHLDDDEKAVALHRNFMSSCLSGLDRDDWQLDSGGIGSLIAGYVDVPMTLDQLLAKARRS